MEGFLHHRHILFIKFRGNLYIVNINHNNEGTIVNKTKNTDKYVKTSSFVTKITYAHGYTNSTQM